MIHWYVYPIALLSMPFIWIPLYFLGVALRERFTSWRSKNSHRDPNRAY